MDEHTCVCNNIGYIMLFMHWHFLETEKEFYHKSMTEHKIPVYNWSIYKHKLRTSKELFKWESSFEHPKHIMLKLMDKKILIYLGSFYIGTNTVLHPMKRDVNDDIKFQFHIGSSVVSAWPETEGPQVRASPAPLCCVWARHIYPCLVLVQLWKFRPIIIENLWLESNKHQFLQTVTFFFMISNQMLCYIS